MRALSLGFVWDDQLMVLQNPWLRDLANVPLAFVRSEVGYRSDITANYFRPLKNVAYILTYQVAGLRPWAYHLWNVLLHVAASGLVFAICRDVLLGRLPHAAREATWFAAAAAAIFAVHPIHTEPVSWIAALPEVGYTAFGLLALYAHARWRRTEEAAGAWRLLSIASFSVALLWKEPAIAFLPALAIHDVTVARRGRRDLRALWPHALVAAAYLLLRDHALGGFVPTRGLEAFSGAEVALNAAPLFGEYLLRLVVPWPLSAYHALVPVASVLEPRVLLSLAAFGGVAAASFEAVRRRAPAALGLALLVVPLLPVLYVPAVGENAFAERYLYLPSAGFVLLVALGLARAEGRRRWLGAALPAIVLLFGALTVLRTGVWRDDLTLWTDNARSAPAAFTPNAAAGGLLAGERRWSEAIPYFQAALRAAETGMPFATRAERATSRYTALNNLGSAYVALGHLDLAAAHLHAALALDPAAPEVHNNLGRVALRKGDANGAIEHFRTALELAPDAPEGVRHNLANAYRAAGRPADADAVLRGVGR